MHPPKREIFDLVAGTNTDPKGIVRPVDVYTVRPWGLYLARPTPGRTQFHYLESWLLPRLGVRVSVFHFTPGHERDQDFYLDIGRYTPGPSAWRAEDHYLDLLLRTGFGSASPTSMSCSKRFGAACCHRTTVNGPLAGRSRR